MKKTLFFNNARETWATIKWAFIRWKYTVKTFRSHAARLNRCVDVENELLRHAARGEPVTSERCKELAYKLGVPANLRKGVRK